MVKARAPCVALLLADFFLQHLRPKDSGITGFAEETIDCFRHYRWPGNVRELRNVIERTLTPARGTEIEVSDFPPQLRNMDADNETRDATMLSEISRDEALDSADRAYLTALLKKHDGVIASAARQADLSHQGLNKLLKRPEISADEFR